MKRNEFIRLTIGEVIYCDETGDCREVFSNIPEEWANDDSEIYTRNALLRGSEAYYHDKQDIPITDHAKWKKWTRIEDVQSRDLRERIMLYELRMMKAIIYHPGSVDTGLVNHFI